MQTYSLYDLNEYIRRVLALNFREPLWITAEVAQVGRSRGHFYLELVQKSAEPDADGIVAQAQAALWAREHQRLRRALGPALDEVLREGVELRLQVRVDFHERYGLKLHIEDIDPAYTFGQLELQRRRTIELLRAQGLLDSNRRLPLPRVLQRIAVISAETAAGYQDFREHLAHNTFGYAFQTTFFASAMQGQYVETEMKAALAQISRRSRDFDAVAVLRGGGARLDLAAFDQPELCRAVAQMPLPVFSGIGHDVDETVLDLVAHTALKTPTAVADFLVQHNLVFENALLWTAEALRNAGQYQLGLSALELERTETALHWNSRDLLQKASARLDALHEHLPLLSSRLLQSHHHTLRQAELLCAALDPLQVLRRGYSLTLKAGKSVGAASELQPSDHISIRFADGDVEAVVE